MKGIFKIKEYFPDTKQILVSFAKLHSPQSIDNYDFGIVDLDNLDLYDNSTFIDSLLDNIGDRAIIKHEETDPIVNQAEKINMDDKVNIPDLVGRVIECKSQIRKFRKLKMRKIEL